VSTTGTGMLLRASFSTGTGRTSGAEGGKRIEVSDAGRIAWAEARVTQTDDTEVCGNLAFSIGDLGMSCMPCLVLLSGLGWRRVRWRWRRSLIIRSRCRSSRAAVRDLGHVGQGSNRRGKLAVVKAMTTSANG
jgi:hypothetical protein